MGTVGTVSTRRAACHQCPACWVGDRLNCTNKAYTGPPTPIVITRQAEAPAAGVQRMERTARNRSGIMLAEKVKKGSVVCIETHQNEQTFPWVIGTVVSELQNAAAASSPYDASKDPVHFEPLKVGEPALEVTLYEALQPGSTTYTTSKVTLWVPARRIRVIDVELEEVRSSGRNQANANVSTSFPRVTIEPNSLLCIRAEMPTENDDWKVEQVIYSACPNSTPNP